MASYLQQTLSDSASNIMDSAPSVANIAPPEAASNNGFSTSNSAIGKSGFILIVLIGFIFVLRFSVAILSSIFQRTTETKLINGMVDAKQLKVIPQDPEASGAKTLTRSVNEAEGIEFTWSCWIYIDDLTYNQGQYKTIFYKGNDYESAPDAEFSGMNFPNNAPGLYLAPYDNTLLVTMNTFTVLQEEVIVSDIPLNKWVNVILRCQNRTLDIYINGTIAKSHILHGVPRQNYGNVFVGMNGGFSGNVSNLSYFNYALGTDRISRIQKQGANTTMVGGEGGMSITTPDYLSLRWYF